MYHLAPLFPGTKICANYERQTFCELASDYVIIVSFPQRTLFMNKTMFIRVFKCYNVLKLFTEFMKVRVK